MANLIRQPLYWAWFFVALWLMHSIYTLYMQRWTGVIVSLTGLLAALMVCGTIQSRRWKNFHSDEGRWENLPSGES